MRSAFPSRRSTPWSGAFAHGSRRAEHRTPLGDGTERACKIEFRLTYGFASQTLAKVVGPVFDKIAGNLVDAFVKRADQVYGA